MKETREEILRRLKENDKETRTYYPKTRENSRIRKYLFKRKVLFKNFVKKIKWKFLSKRKKEELLKVLDNEVI